MSLLSILGDILMPIDAIGAFLGIEGGDDQANADETALNSQARQTRLNYLTKQNAQLSQLNKTIEQQQVIQSTRGVSLGSPSFQATQISTYNTAARNLKNQKLQERVSQDSFDIKRHEIESEKDVNIWKSLLGGAESIILDKVLL